MSDDIATRLDRMDSKLEKLAEAMVTLARVEERLAHYVEGQQALTTRVNTHGQRLDGIEQVQAQRAWIERAAWAVLLGAVSFGWWLAQGANGVG